MQQGLVHVNRLKQGIQSAYPIQSQELRVLGRLLRDYPDTDYVFVCERKASLTTDVVRKIVGQTGELTNIGFSIHPHMLRHATGDYVSCYAPVFRIN